MTVGAFRCTVGHTVIDTSTSGHTIPRQKECCLSASQARPMLTMVVVRSGLASVTHDKTRVKSSCFHSPRCFCGKNTSVRFSRRLDSRTPRTRRTSAQVSFVVRKHCQCIKLTISLSDVVKNPRLRASMPKSESSPLHTMKRKHL